MRITRIDDVQVLGRLVQLAVRAHRHGRRPRAAGAKARCTARIESVETAIREYRAASRRPGSRRARAALAAPLQRLALARRRGVPDRAGRARHRAVGPRGQAPRRAGRAAARRRAAHVAARATRATGCRARTRRRRRHAGAREAVRRGFSAFKCRPFSYEGLRANEAGEIRKRRRADRGRARRRRARRRDLHRVQRVPVAAHAPCCSTRAARRFARAGSRSRSRSRTRKAMAQLQRDIRTPIATGERLLSRFEYREILENARLPHHPARPDARRRLHRDPQDRRAGGHVLRAGRAAQSRRADLHGRRDASRGRDPEFLHPRADGAAARVARSRVDACPSASRTGTSCCPRARGSASSRTSRRSQDMSFRPQPRTERAGALYC